MANTSATLDATTTPFSLSLLTATKGNASKKLIADAHGQPIRDPTHTLAISTGRLEHVELAGVAGLRDLLSRVTSKQALVHGIVKGSRPGDVHTLTTVKEVDTHPGAVARSLQHIAYPDSVKLLMFDVDPYPDAPQHLTHPDELMSRLATIWPAFTDVGYLATASTSSSLKDKAATDPDAWIRQPDGWHVYVLARGDVARWRDVATVGLWCAETGWCKLASANTQTGVSAVLTRCLVDLTVWSPERLDYVASAVIPKTAPFFQARPAPVLRAGGIIDLDALPDVTDAERQQYQALVRAERERIQPERVDRIRAYIRRAAPTIDDAIIDREVTTRLQRAQDGALLPEHPLEFANGTRVTAGEVSAKQDNQRLADPFEPDYGPNHAVFHWNNGRWLINSFAHGTLKTYRLAQEYLDAPEPDPDEPWPDADADVPHNPNARRIGPYEATRHGLVWWKPAAAESAVKVTLTNFTAQIVGDIVEDDGAETRRYFELEACHEGHTIRFPVEAAHFAGMTWAMEYLGARAMVYPGIMLKDHARAAVQMFSKDVQNRHVYTHVGWRQIDETWCYLHAGGALGPDGPVSAVEVAARHTLAAYTLPLPTTHEAQHAAVRASLRLLDTATDTVTVPLYAAIWRAVLGTADFSLHLVGQTGAGKSELAALAQQHFGSGMTARHLPAAWTSTGNALEALAFEAKDVLLVVDDFCPSGSQADMARFHRDADRLLRAQGNHSGRQRMRFDGTLRPVKAPRGLIVSTGEDTPQGQSLRSRILVLDVVPGSVDWATIAACQADAVNGLYAMALAGFVQWLAPRYAQISHGLRAEITALRQAALSTGHRRTPEIVGNLALGMQYLLTYGQDIGALTVEECTVLWQRTWTALVHAGEAQRDQQANEEPVRRFLALLSGALVAGLAHVADVHTLGQPTTQPEPWGWRGREYHTRNGELEMAWDAQGPCVGWLANDRLYLEPEAAYSVVQKFGESQKAPLPISQQTLWKRMHEQELLIRNPSQEKNKVLRSVGGRRQYVIDVSSNLVASIDAETGTTGTSGTEGQQHQQNQGNKPYRFPVWHAQNRYGADTKPVRDTPEVSAESRSGQQPSVCTGFPKNAVPVFFQEPVQKNSPQPQQNQSAVPAVPVVPVSAAYQGQTFSDETHTHGEPPTAPPDVPPCANCGVSDRWHDVSAGVYRCIACDPPRRQGVPL